MSVQHLLIHDVSLRPIHLLLDGHVSKLEIIIANHLLLGHMTNWTIG